MDKYSPVLASKFIDASLSGRDFIYNYECFEKRVLSDLDLFKTLPHAEKIKALLNKRKNESIGFKWPVALVNEKIMSLLDVKVSTLLLSDDTIIKQLVNRRGQRITRFDYSNINQLIKKIRYFSVEENKITIYCESVKLDNFYQIVLKSTRDKDELYLLSFFELNAERVLAGVKANHIKVWIE